MISFTEGFRAWGAKTVVARQLTRAGFDKVKDGLKDIRIGLFDGEKVREFAKNQQGVSTSHPNVQKQAS